MTEFHSQELSGEQGRRRAIKCVVWDLDNTLWDGVLLEDAAVGLRSEVIGIIKTLDARGILHCIASRNDFEKSMEKLEEFGLREFFLYPQINWNSKVSSVKAIADSIGIALDAIAFVDDDPFERAEMNFSCPEVLCIDAADLSRMTVMPEMTPEVISSDAKVRRLRYLNNIAREKAEAEFVGPQEDFLATLGMVFSIAPAGERDLERAEELTVRTHQLNSTGYTYSFDQLNRFRQSDTHQLLITSLRDKFGSYGTIGLALIECEQTVWTLKLLLMSCRVVSRGVGTILLNHIMEQASKQNVILRAEFVPTDRNRMMYITYKFAGFKEQGRHGDCLILENDLSRRQLSPAYVKVRYCSAPSESG
jgi:FkbH-like protein